MPTKNKEGVPIIFLELVDQGDSGFVMNGTERSSLPQVLRNPTVSWVPTEGTEVYMDKDKDGNNIKRNRKIRHIKGCEIIYPQEQEKAGFTPNRTTDKIPFDNGFASVLREGNTISTYDYLIAATYFIDNPLRPDTATPIYREVKINERAMTMLDEDELQTAAKSKVYALRLNTGGGENSKYKFDEEKINTYCNLLNVYADSPQQQLALLLDIAIRTPKTFLDTIVMAEQTVITEVSHALQLKVISFDKNVVQYVAGNKIITSLESGNRSETRKIEAFAAWLQTAEGTPALTELRTNLELEKERQFKA